MVEVRYMGTRSMDNVVEFMYSGEILGREKKRLNEMAVADTYMIENVVSGTVGGRWGGQRSAVPMVISDAALPLVCQKNVREAAPTGHIALICTWIK